jgi:hypothetical protein
MRSKGHVAWNSAEKLQHFGHKAQTEEVTCDN